MRTSLAVSVLASSLFCVGSRSALAELRATSRNEIVFVEAEGEDSEWSAYRRVDASSPVELEAPGPGRLVLRFRLAVDPAAAEAMGSVDAAAEIQVDGSTVLTARVESSTDAAARFVGAEKLVPSRPRLYLVRLEPGGHRVTIRLAEGESVLLSPRLVELSGDEPLGVDKLSSSKDESVLPGRSRSMRNESWDTTRRASRLERSGPTGLGPELEGAERRRPRRSSAAGLHRLWTSRAPYFTAAFRGGLHVSRLDLRPAPVLGIEARSAIPGLDARRWSAGISGDVSHGEVDRIAVGASSAAAVDVARLVHTEAAIGVDGRHAFILERGGIEPYVSVGGGVIFGRMEVARAGLEKEAGLLGGFASFRVGAALGEPGGRPVLEFAFLGGKLRDTEILRGSEAGQDSAYGAFHMTLGYRVELLADLPPP